MSSVASIIVPPGLYVVLKAMVLLVISSICLFCNVVAGSSDFGISGVKVMFNYAMEVGLYEAIVFTEFFELMALLSNVDALLVLDIQAGDVIGFFFEDVSCWGVVGDSLYG